MPRPSANSVALACLAVMACARSGIEGLRGLDAEARDSAVVELPSGDTTDQGPADGGQAPDAADKAYEGDAQRDAGKEAAVAQEAGSEGAPELDGGTRDGVPVRDATVVDAALYDAGAVATPAPLPPVGSCDLSGSWAYKVSMPVNWSGPGVAPGMGTLTLWLLYQGTHSGSTWTGNARACGLTLPDYRGGAALVQETFGARIPDSTFDHQPPYLTPFDARISLAGNSLSFGQAALTLGVQLPNPGVDAWPARSTLTSVDADLDGKPGLSVDYLRDASHAYPPLDDLGSQRAARSYQGLRLAFLGNGQLTSCSEHRGLFSFSRFDTHVIGCELSDGGACTSAMVDYLDGSRPTYTPSAPQYRALKVADDTTCEQVRSQLP